MTKRLWSGVLAASLLLAAWPERTQAAETPNTLRGAVERVIAQAEKDRTGIAPRIAGSATTLDSDEAHDLAQRVRALKSNPVAGQMSGGGGMGKMLIMTLLTTAVSVGAYMYIIKKSNQQTTTATLR